LTRCFGTEHIFWDYDSIHGGGIFSKDIQNALNLTTTFLAVIGRDWLNVEKDGKRRIDNPEDVLRREIATALERADGEEKVNVIPVLVEGASCPLKEDLPDDLKNLVDRQCIEIRPHHWKEDVKPLIQIIKKDFEPKFLYSFLIGSIGGLIAGVIVGWLYYNAKHSANPDVVRVDRIFYGGLYGLFSGATLSYFINSGITWRSRLLKSPYSKIVGGAVGGVLGGILAGIAGGFLFAWLRGGGEINTTHLTWAVAGASILLTLGILLPEMKGAWYKKVLPIIIIVCVTLVAVAITGYVLGELTSLMENPAKQYPFSKEVLILGSIWGVMSGFQVGLALSIYDRFKIKLGNTP
jgi:hypothetical protein